MKSGYQSANSASARKYARCWWVEFLVDGSSSWTLHERCIVLVFFKKIKQQINWHLLLRCHSLFVFSNVCEFDIWVFASADGSGQIRMRVALRGWNQLLGKTGVGQGGESWGRRYVYYQIYFLSVCGHFSLSHSADIRPARNSHSLLLHILWSLLLLKFL